MQPQYTYRAYISKVIDGDTVDARVDLGFTVSVDVRFRLAGIDTPEIHSPDATVREAAQRAKQFTQANLLAKTVMLKSTKADKYGRWLAEIFIDDTTTINQLLIENDLATPYSGGSRG